MNTIEKYKTVADFNKSAFNKRHIFILNHRNPEPSITHIINNKASGFANYFPLMVSIPMEDQVFDRGKQAMRVIRYIPGEMSIFKDEQGKDDMANPRVASRLEFHKGEAVIDGRETQKLEFMKLTNWNGANEERDPNKGVKFFAVDLEKSMKREMEAERKVLDAVMWCHTASDTDIQAFATVVGVDMTQEMSGLRWSLKKLAEADPSRFFKLMDNKATKRKHNLLMAIEKGIVTKDVGNNALKWNGGGIIDIAPMGKDIVDFFVDRSFGDENGEKIYAVICGFLDNEKKAEAPKAEVKKEPEVKKEAVAKPEPIDFTAEKELMDQAVAAGVVTRSGAWFVYTNEAKAIGPQKFLELLKNTEVFEAIKVEVLAKAEPVKQAVRTIE